MIGLHLAAKKKGGGKMGLVLLAPALIALMVWALYAVNQMDDDD